jgi:hypothetical protein
MKKDLINGLMTAVILIERVGITAVACQCATRVIGQGPDNALLL